MAARLPYAFVDPSGGKDVEGEVLASEPPHRLVRSWRTVFANFPTTTVTWTIEPHGDACKVTLHHSGLDPATPEGQGLVLQL